MTVGVKGIRIKGNALREMLKQIVYQSHMVVSVNIVELYPVADEDMVIREINSKV